MAVQRLVVYGPFGRESPVPAPLFHLCDEAFVLQLLEGSGNSSFGQVKQSRGLPEAEPKPAIVSAIEPRSQFDPNLDGRSAQGLPSNAMNHPIG